MVYPSSATSRCNTRHQARFYARNGEAINHNPRELIQTQDLDPIYEENSCIYLFTRENLIKFQHRIGENPLIFEIPALEAVDIDEESDFMIADILMRERHV